MDQLEAAESAAVPKSERPIKVIVGATVIGVMNRRMNPTTPVTGEFPEPRLLFYACSMQNILIIQAS